MAKANRLQRFSYQSLVTKFAKEFGQSPSYVEANESFDTIIACLWEMKEEGEFNIRFNNVWKEINK